ncbi:hypothetical protein R3P38DRAFT_3352253 [Favolaschia claudopus]|uniref:Uncharacterized protein n=1 Tax=Favolaschia claudopus TaxID=2862362 RepID=A0AAW0C1K0_9AGAR
MQSIPWPVSPEFEDALLQATQRHLAQSQPSSVSPQQQRQPQRCPDYSPSPRSSSSLTMKTRVTVRDNTPHRFHVVPLREVPKNRDSESLSNSRNESFTPAPWTRQLALLRPSGVGLGLNIVRRVLLCADSEFTFEKQPSSLDNPERGRERAPRQREMLTGNTLVSRKGILNGLQGLSPKRHANSQDRKENRVPVKPDTIITQSPTKRGRRQREERLDALPASVPNNLSAHTAPSTKENIVIDAVNAPSPSSETPLPTQQDLDLTIVPHEPPALVSEAPLVLDPRRNTIAFGDVRLSSHSVSLRHFKSPSLGTIHHLLSTSSSTSTTSSISSVDDPENTTPRVRCRKRTNTLSIAHASTKRYGVYTSGILDFSPVAIQEDIDALRDSTYSLGALLSAYSYDSLPSLYSQDSFVSDRGYGYGTQPLRVQVRALKGRIVGGQAHATVLELIDDLDEAIAEWH